MHGITARDYFLLFEAGDSKNLHQDVTLQILRKNSAFRGKE